MNQNLDSESLDRMIRAMEDYNENLQTNMRILENAVAVCDQIMGSDAIAQKFIQRTDRSLEKFNKILNISENLMKELEREKKDALNIVENA